MHVTNDVLDLGIGEPVAAWAARALRATPGFSGAPVRSPQAILPVPPVS